MASKAVNRPTDVKQKEVDINNKLQLYGIYSAFGNRKLPSNKQIDVALNSALASKALSAPPEALSVEGRKLVADLREVIVQAKKLLLSKNEGNLIQDFIWQTEHISANDVGALTAPIDKATSQQHGRQALEGLRTLGQLIITNGQFRKLLSDATILLRDMVGDGATSLASRVNPNEDQLAQIDDPAADNTWHEAPNLSKDSLQARIKSQFGKSKPGDQDDVQQAAKDSPQAASSSTDPMAVAGQAVSKDIDRPGGKLQDRQRQLTEKSMEYLKGKMPKERREQTIWRLKKMVVEIQGHADYQQAIETLLSLAEAYAGHGTDVHQQGVGAVKGAHTDNNIKAAEADLKTILERFANSTSSDDLIESIRTIYRDAERDPELKNWFKSVNTYIRKCLQEQGFIVEDQSTTEYNEIYDRGRYLLRERYRSHTDRIVDEFKFMGDQFDKDPHNKAFGLAVQRLFLDLGNDASGKLVFKKHLVKDLTNVILPGIFENVRYVPIPRIEVSDPQIDAVIENLVVESDNLMPNVLEVGSDNYFRWGRKKISNKHDNKIMISASGIQMDLRDVSYYVKRKQGFPHITDKGVMDIFLGGEGFSFKIQASTTHKSDSQHFFKLDSCKVNIKNMDIKLKQSNHKWLFRFFKPLLFKMIKPVMTKVLERQISELFNKADAYAWDIQNEANRALEAAQNDPENAPNIFLRYVNAIKQNMIAHKNMAVEKTSKTKVNVATTQAESIFPQIQLPGGISTKATKFKELAAKGEKWESPIFSIGDATESGDIPKVNPVTRKPHGATSGTLNGGTYTNGDVNGSAPSSGA